MRETFTYKFISYDVWGNDEYGYEVNAAYFTGETVTLSNTMNDSEIINKLKEKGFIKSIETEDIEIEGEEGNSLYFIHTPTWYPMFELREENI